MSFEAFSMDEQRSTKLGLELYPLEATTAGEPLFPSIYLPSATEHMEHTFPNLSSLPVVISEVGYGGFGSNYYNFIRRCNSFGGKRNAGTIEDVENRNGKTSQRSSNICVRRPKTTFHNLPILRKTTLQELRIPGKLLVQLQVEFLFWNPRKITEEISEDLRKSSKSRQFLTIRKVLDSNTIILSFSSSSYPSRDTILEENEIQISLNLWRVNCVTFENRNFNLKNHDESGDEWIDMLFITAREFIEVVWFILRSFKKTNNDSRITGNRLSYPPFFASRIRSNIKELLEGKTLMKYIPNELNKDLLPSQVEFMVGLFEQITTHRTYRPCSSKTKISVLKLEDFEKAIKKCISFYYFSINKR